MCAGTLIVRTESGRAAIFWYAQSAFRRGCCAIHEYAQALPGLAVDNNLHRLAQIFLRVRRLRRASNSLTYANRGGSSVIPSRYWLDEKRLCAHAKR
ncbi:hypothetical protein KCP73_05730 [Salmonella enterica subsp. enterica]|nr:hypothetical protein KCP73_05730 [Salmonella enterica subsp. enterica]